MLQVTVILTMKVTKLKKIFWTLRILCVKVTFPCSDKYVWNATSSNREKSQHIHLLNKKQRKVFNTVYSWLVTYLKNPLSQDITTLQPLFLFITGGTGVGKSFLSKILCQSLTKTFFTEINLWINQKFYF